jgi:GNAT superfamily N-acetyltransferase
MMLYYILATYQDCDLLTATALQSKRYWNYPDELMQLWKDELTIDANYIGENSVVKVFDDKEFIGFFSLVEIETGVEIDHFWLVPNSIRKGYGKVIFAYIREHVKKINKTRIELTADPNAKIFYEKMGGKLIRSFESKVKGRYLDVYEFQIE